MTQFDFGAFSKELTSVEENGVTFEDKQLKWNTAEDVKEIIEALDSQKIVNFLKLEGNTLGVEAAEAIGKALQKHPEFKKALWRNMFTGRLKTEIPQALKVMGAGLILAKAQLTVLDLSDNALGPNGMVGLEELLRSSVCYSLKELHLNNCGLGIGGGRMLSKALLDCHLRSTDAGTPLALKIFVVGRNRLENEGAKHIAKIFSTIKTLEDIRMPQNSIFHQGIAALSVGLKENTSLRVLNLNDNIIGSKGAEALSNAFASMPNLTEVNFGDCLLKTSGVCILAEALEEKHGLERIDLGFNEIGLDGGLVITSAMQNKASLQYINLDGNQFGDEGCDRIKECMLEALNPHALCSLEEDEGEPDDEDDENQDADDDKENDADDGDGEEEEEYLDDKNNDTTEEADEEEDYQDGSDNEDEDEEQSQMNYVTAYTTKLSNTSGNEDSSFFSNQSTTFTNGNNSVLSNTIEEFCVSRTPCTLTMFQSIKNGNTIDDFKKCINQFFGEEYLIVLIFTALKCANLSRVSTDALNVAIELYAESFKYAKETDQQTRVMNFFLQQLGLLRCENKFKNLFDRTSCRYAFRETLNKKELPEEVTKTFTIFLDRCD